jgi:intracellular multiplication protein IcmP
MSGGAAPSQGGGGDNSYEALWIVVLIALMSMAIWFMFDAQLKMAFIGLRMGEFWLLNTIIQPVQPYLPWDISVNFIFEMTQKLTVENLSMSDVMALSTVSGEYLRWPYLMILGGILVYALKTNVHMRLKVRHTAHTLRLREQENWPQIKPVTHLDLVAEDLEEGPWAMAMTPMQFARKYKLIEVHLAPPKESIKNQSEDFVVTILPERTDRAFAAQLGRPWEGWRKMAPHRRAIFAALLCRIARDAKTSYKLVAQLAASSARGQLNIYGVDEICKKHDALRRVQELSQQHAYELTFMTSILMAAREDGVVPSADFLWVKPIDRRLWLTLNNVGRQTPAVEVGGIFAHWYMETALKRPFSQPMINEAIRAFGIALSEVIYVPSETEREAAFQKAQAIRGKS